MFSGRSKALIVDGRGNGYLKTVCDYVHLNPVRAKLLRPEQRWLEYPWSSFGLYLAAPAPRPAWLRVDPPRRIEAVEMGRGRTASAAQDRPGEAGDSRTVAPRDHLAVAVDRGPAAPGNLEEPQRQTTSLAESERKVLTNRSRL